MQSLRETLPAGCLLFVRSIVDLPCALRHVNELLAWRRSSFSPSDVVLGILVGETLEASFREPGQPGTRDPRVHTTLRESVALSGIWSLCWFDLGEAESWEDHGGLRRSLLDNLRLHAHSNRGDAAWRRVLFPVLTCSEAREGGEAIIEDLETRYPTLTIGRQTYVHDPARGELVRHGGRDEVRASWPS